MALWTSLNERERGKFLRHVRPYWDTHRHRIPLDLVGDVEQLILEGTLMIHRARIIDSAPRESGIRVTLRPRVGQEPYDVAVSVEDIAKAEEEARRLVGLMRGRSFEASPGQHCGRCDVRDLCAHRAEDSHSGRRSRRSAT